MQGQGTSLSYTQQQAALSAADNLTALYTLSIVQLSNPGHANLSALLSTADANATVVCGPSSDAATLIDSMQAAADALARESPTVSSDRASACVNALFALLGCCMDALCLLCLQCF